MSAATSGTRVEDTATLARAGFRPTMIEMTRELDDDLSQRDCG
jgi:hypothetical protein